MEVLSVLPTRYRAVLELRFLHAYTAEETAQALGITAANVKVTQHRALAKAADLMEDGMGRPVLSAGQAQAIA